MKRCPLWIGTQTLSQTGSGGSNILRPGYFVVIRAPEGKIEREKLCSIGDQLHLRARVAKQVAQKIKETELIALLTDEEGIHHVLEAGMDIVHALQYTKRNDLKILLRAALDQHPFTMTVRTAILNALGNTRD